VESEENNFWVPIDPRDARELGAMLLREDVFTASFPATTEEVYDPCTYLLQKQRFDVETRLLVDRNVVTRWMAISRGQEVQKEHRLAAAALAFAQCSKISVEPNISLYEFARTQGSVAAHEELLLFRRADEVHPGFWAEVALARSDTVPLPVSQPLGPNDLVVDFEMGLRRWNRNYILALQIARLELDAGEAESKMRQLLQWMYDEFLLGGPAIILGAMYLAPGARRRGLFKCLRSPDRSKAVHGIRNAAWDITLVSEFLRATEEQTGAEQLNLLVSFDKAVHRIARGALEGMNPRAKTPLLVKLWGERAGLDLAQEVERLYATANAPDRQLNRPAPADFIDSLIKSGEERILDWSPTDDV